MGVAIRYGRGMYFPERTRIRGLLREEVTGAGLGALRQLDIYGIWLLAKSPVG